MISRRSVLQRGTAAMVLAGTAAVAVQCRPTEAPAVGYDPLLDLVQRYEVEERRFEATPHPTDEEAEADRAHLDELWDELRDATPTATTEAGALAALRLAHNNMRFGHGGFQRPLVGAAIAFYHGRTF